MATLLLIEAARGHMAERERETEGEGKRGRERERERTIQRTVLLSLYLLLPSGLYTRM
jgi:hypothetical protein